MEFFLNELTQVHHLGILHTKYIFFKNIQCNVQDSRGICSVHMLWNAPIPPHLLARPLTLSRESLHVQLPGLLLPHFLVSAVRSLPVKIHRITASSREKPAHPSLHNLPTSRTEDLKQILWPCGVDRQQFRQEWIRGMCRRHGKEQTSQQPNKLKFKDVRFSECRPQQGNRKGLASSTVSTLKTGFRQHVH